MKLIVDVGLYVPLRGAEQDLALSMYFFQGTCSFIMNSHEVSVQYNTAPTCEHVSANPAMQVQ